MIHNICDALRAKTSSRAKAMICIRETGMGAIVRCRCFCVRVRSAANIRQPLPLVGVNFAGPAFAPEKYPADLVGSIPIQILQALATSPQRERILFACVCFGSDSAPTGIGA